MVGRKESYPRKVAGKLGFWGPHFTITIDRKVGSELPEAFRSLWSEEKFKELWKDWQQDLTDPIYDIAYQEKIEPTNYYITYLADLSKGFGPTWITKIDLKRVLEGVTDTQDPIRYPCIFYTRTEREPALRFAIFADGKILHIGTEEEEEKDVQKTMESLVKMLRKAKTMESPYAWFFKV